MPASPGCAIVPGSTALPSRVSPVSTSAVLGARGGNTGSAEQLASVNPAPSSIAGNNTNSLRDAATAYSPSNAGLRFSRKAAMPSFWAGVPKPAWK